MLPRKDLAVSSGVQIDTSTNERFAAMDKRDGPRVVRIDGSINAALLQHVSPLDLVNQINMSAGLLNQPFEIPTPREIHNAIKRVHVEQLSPSMTMNMVEKIASVVAQADQPNQDKTSAYNALRGRVALSHLLAGYLDRDVPLSAEIIQKIRSFGKSNNIELRELEADNIGKLMVLDQRNASSGESLGLTDQVRQEIFDELMTGSGLDPYAEPLEQRMLAYTLATNRDETLSIMNEFMASNHPVPACFYKVFANTLDFNMMRNEVRDFVSAHPDRKGEFDALATAIGIELGNQEFIQVKDFYKQNTLEGLSAYSELQEKDVQTLAQEFKDAKRVLDIGCGTGRLLIPLRKQGIPVEGIDTVESYGQAIKKQDPRAHFTVGSMDALPFKDGSFEVAFMLGRTFAHMKSVKHGIEILKGIRRILSPQGTLVMDMADVSGGEYAQRAVQRMHMLDKARIWNYEPGTLHDSPDNVNFFDRLIPGEKQIRSMATIAGFKPIIIGKQEYNAGNKKATNAYWELIPTEQPELTKDQELEVTNYLSPQDTRPFGVESNGGLHVFGYREVAFNILDY